MAWWRLICLQWDWLQVPQMDYQEIPEVEGDVGVYPNTGSQASMITSKGGDSFLPFAKQVTEMLKNPGTGRWAKSTANTTAK